jgi:hypothetical protein
MKPIYYSAAWTDTGFFFDCSHEHMTIAEANSCIPCAGGCVVAVESGVMRALTSAEEAEFQRVHDAPHASLVSEETAADDPRHAVMTRIRAGDRWIWTTWRLYATYTEAVAHARNGNKAVRFRSAEYLVLRKETGAASPLVINAKRASIPPQGEGGRSVEFVNRFLSAYGFDQPAEPHSNETHDSMDPVRLMPIGGQEDGSLNSELDEHTSIIETPAYFARLILSRLSQPEIEKLGRMRNQDIAILLMALGRVFSFKAGGKCQ